VTIHHELGHNYYFHYYNHLPALYQGGANDGFHEGIGDTLALSVTPSYLQKIGVIDKAADDPQSDLNVLMQRALEGVAFLPFGKLIDEWRWDVFREKSARTTTTRPVSCATATRIAAPVARSESDFDPLEVPHPGQRPLHPLFHRADSAVPVPSCVCAAAILVRSTSAASTATAHGQRMMDMLARSEQALAGSAGDHHWRKGDGCDRDHRLLRARSSRG
jgi:peptidyl-dipeptidase A